MDWDEAMGLVRSLFKNGHYTISLLVATGCFTGLRISDILTLSYSDLFGSELEIVEKKTRKRRSIRINADLRKHAMRCFKASGFRDASRKAFISKKKTVFCVQRVNIIFKELKEKYGLRVRHFSTHSLRKTFGRRVVELSGTNSEMALIKLSDIFHHSSVMTTRIYLGLRKEELLETYDLLSMS